MNYFPSIQPKKKILRFSNLLVGETYDNKNFVHSCYSTQMQNNSFDNGENKNQYRSSFLIRTKKFSLNNQQSTAQIQTSFNSVESNEKYARADKIYSVTKRLAHPKHHCSKHSQYSQQSPLKYSPLRTTETSGVENFPNTLNVENQLKVQLSGLDVQYKFKDAQVLILEAVKKQEDFLCKILVINFGKYFNCFFKSQLSGALPLELIEVVQKYICHLINERKVDEKIEYKAFPQESFILNTKKGLLKKIKQLEEDCNLAEIEAIVKFYCVPTLEYRESCLRDSLLKLKISAYQKFNTSQDYEYVFLDETGNRLNDFIEIVFSTNKLFLSRVDKVQESYDNYQRLVESSLNSKDKLGFNEILKANFRSKIMKGRYEENKQNQKLTKEQQETRRRNRQQAQLFASKKYEKSSQIKQQFKRFMNRSVRKSLLKDSREKKLAFPQKSNEKIFYISSIEDKIQKQFKELKLLYDYINPEYKNQVQSVDKLPLDILLSNSIYFKNKSWEESYKILVSLKLIHKDIKQSETSQLIITCVQYAEMRKIINCLASREAITSFFNNYLPYDEYGEFTRKQLSQIMQSILQKDVKAARIIEEITWSWLQKNKVITNHVLRMNQMNSLYESNKMVYYFLISLIFGTNETTVLELAQDILT